MSDKRRFIQPHNRLYEVSNDASMGENENEFGTQLGKVREIMTSLTRAFRARYRGTSTSGVFGATNVSDSAISALLFNLTPAILIPTGMR